MVTITKLRENIYQLINEVIETGKPLIIKRKDGNEVIVSSIKKESRLARIKPVPFGSYDPNAPGKPDMSYMKEWYKEWGIEPEEGGI